MPQARMMRMAARNRHQGSSGFMSRRPLHPGSPRTTERTNTVSYTRSGGAGILYYSVPSRPDESPHSFSFAGPSASPETSTSAVQTGSSRRNVRLLQSAVRGSGGDQYSREGVNAGTSEALIIFGNRFLSAPGTECMSVELTKRERTRRILDQEERFRAYEEDNGRSHREVERDTKRNEEGRHAAISCISYCPL